MRRLGAAEDRGSLRRNRMSCMCIHMGMDVDTDADVNMDMDTTWTLVWTRLHGIDTEWTRHGPGTDTR